MDLNQDNPRLQAFLNAMEKWPDLSLLAAEPAVNDALLFLHGSLPEYAQTLPDQIYIRTGTLGRRITERVRREDTQVIGDIGMDTPYAPWVIGPDFPGEQIEGKVMYQAKIHKDRWWQFYNVMEENQQAANEVFSKKFIERFNALVVEHMRGLS
jgi:hypothetical protein